MYFYKYSNPDSRFKKTIIKDNIKFFPELFEYEQPFLIFSQWALTHNFVIDIGNIYLDRKDINKNFSMDNCYWTNEYKENGTMIFIKK